MQHGETYLPPSAFHQSLPTWTIALAAHGTVQGCGTRSIGGVHIGPGVQECHHHNGVAFCSRTMQSCSTVFVTNPLAEPASEG